MPLAALRECCGEILENLERRRRRLRKLTPPARDERLELELPSKTAPEMDGPEYVRTCAGSKLGPVGGGRGLGERADRSHSPCVKTTNRPRLAAADDDLLLLEAGRRSRAHAKAPAD